MPACTCARVGSNREGLTAHSDTSRWPGDETLLSECRLQPVERGMFLLEPLRLLVRPVAAFSARQRLATSSSVSRRYRDGSARIFSNLSARRRLASAAAFRFICSSMAAAAASSCAIVRQRATVGHRDSGRADWYCASSLARTLDPEPFMNAASHWSLTAVGRRASHRT
jgi:hypothetical protein